MAQALGTAKGLHKAGVMELITLREFDQLCLLRIEPLRPEQIQQIRETAQVSQSAIAKLPHLEQKRGLEAVG